MKAGEFPKDSDLVSGYVFIESDGDFSHLHLEVGY